MMKFLSNRKFNYIDALGMCIATSSITRGDYVMAAVIILVFSGASAYLEMRA